MEHLGQIATSLAAIEEYVEAHLFDPSGILMSAADCRTGKPFAREFITEEKVARRAMFDPWSWWTYEDSIMCAGHYIDGLVMRYEMTGDATALEQAQRVWRVCLDISYQSQAYGGVGCFLRPYGGFDQMEKFGEPLGTDQAAPLFCGVYRLMRYMADEDRDEASRILVNMLRWYADQGYAYRYYKSHQHYWRPPGHVHASSFYLPAIAFAARETDEQRWHNDLERFLKRQLTDPKYIDTDAGIAWNFKQGGLLVLRDIMGREAFEEHFTRPVLERIHDDVKRWLAKFSEPGTVRRMYPASAEPGFEPYLRLGFSRAKGLGFPATAWVHAGRTRPRHELTVLTALAGLGITAAGEEAARLFAMRKEVPDDFTHFFVEDYDALPPAAHLFACSVGALMLWWYRNARLLMSVAD